MKHVFLLHGAIGAADQLKPLAARLGKTVVTHTLNFSGHGSRAMPTEPFSIGLFAENVLSEMVAQKLNKISILGYSMGGYVGMYLAKHHPDKVEKIVTLGTKYHWDEAIAAREIQMLDPGKIEQKIPAFAASLRGRHAPNDWKQVLQKTAEMMTALGKDNTLKTADYTSITHPSMILLGDRDKMVTLNETVDVFKALPNGQMGILPGTQHPIEQVDLDLLAFMTERFLA